MSPVRIAVLAGALIAAVIAALVVRTMATGHTAVAAPPVAVEKPTVKVLVAARDLQVGDRLVEQDLSWQAWPADGVNPAFTTQGPAAVAPVTEKAKIAKAVDAGVAKVTGSDKSAMQPFVGAAVREPILKNEPVLAAKLVRAGDAGILAVSLAAGQRAMAVPLSAESAAGGFVLPGDHVDVLQTRGVDGPKGKTYVTSTVLKNTKVLAIDQATRAEKSAASVVGATATLEVSPSQAELLAAAKAEGPLTLMLRSYADIEGPASAGELPNRQSSGVRVFRAGVMTEVAVAR